MILAAIIIAKNPAQYGFDVLDAAAAGARHETVELPAASTSAASPNGPASPSTTSSSSTRTAALDDADPRRHLPLKVPAGRPRGPRRGSTACGAERAALELAHGEVRRDAADDFAQAACQPGRPADANYLSVRSRVRPGQS